jgi:DNA-binding CsgD family transcriptional regulator
MYVNGEYISLNWDATAVLKKPIMGHDGRGERIFASGTSRLKIKEGKIVEIWQLWTSKEVEKELDFREHISDEVCQNLTRRQLEVFEWMVQGKTNSEIATILGRSVRTVEKHCEAIFARLGVENRRSAMIMGLLDPNPVTPDPALFSPPGSVP